MAKYNRIKDLREDCDKTQQELADYLGTSSQHYGCLLYTSPSPRDCS